ncbi:MAG TPA: 3'-5' exonuclease [Wenzhouxiangella sp.]|nr:3'-5' exonuclease [Wenzhouxiangella sp.]
MLSLFRREQPATIDWQNRFAELAAESRVTLLRDFYRQAAVAADTPLARTPLIALDLETTGLNPGRHGIVSIGAVPFALDRIRPAAGWYRVVRPRRKIDEHSITIHRITHDEVDRAPDLAEIAEEFLNTLAGRVAVVHFHAIERRFLYQAFLRRFGEGLLFPLIDTLQAEKRVQQRRALDLRAWLFGRRRASLRLADARRRYGLPEYAPHHAWTDALATAELFQAQVGYHGGPEEPVSKWWL